jgi:hypothetical protein
MNVYSVKECLKTCGPLSSKEVALFFKDTTHQNVAAILSRLRRQTHKAVHIQSWEEAITPTGKRWSAVYALGNNKDAKRPRNLNCSERSKRYRDKQKVPNIPNSVWQWGNFV